MPLQTGQDAVFEVREGAEATRLRGVISFVSPVVDPASGLQVVKAEFDNAEGRVRPGVAGTLYVGTGEDERRSNP